MVSRSIDGWKPSAQQRPSPRWPLAERLNQPAGVYIDGPANDRPSTRPARLKRPTTFRTLLVPLDGTPLGERALPMAVSIARRSGAELRLVHVHAPMESLYHPQLSLAFEDAHRQRQIRYLEKIAAQIMEAAAVPVVPHCLERRDIVDGLREAAGRDVDLVVASTHGYGWFERLWYGSTVHKLIELLAPPLLVLRGDGLRAAISPNRWLRRMLVPLDGSKPSEQVLQTAMALGDLYDARYSLFGVVPKTYGDASSWTAGRSGTMHAEHAAERYLRRTVSRLRRKSRRAESSVAVTDEPLAQAIAAQAEASHADCIAIAASRHRGLNRYFRPSQAWRVIQRAEAPVLVVRGEEPE